VTKIISNLREKKITITSNPIKKAKETIQFLNDDIEELTIDIKREKKHIADD
jgi:hypothetical protein